MNKKGFNSIEEYLKEESSLNCFISGFENVNPEILDESNEKLVEYGYSTKAFQNFIEGYIWESLHIKNFQLLHYIDVLKIFRVISVFV